MPKKITVSNAERYRSGWVNRRPCVVDLHMGWAHDMTLEPENVHQLCDDLNHGRADWRTLDWRRLSISSLASKAEAVC